MPHLTTDATITRPLRIGDKVTVYLDGRALPEKGTVALVTRAGMEEDMLTGETFAVRASVSVHADLPFGGQAYFFIDPVSGRDFSDPMTWVCN